MSGLLSVSALRAGYGASTVLHDLDLEVGAGEIVTVIGANGAGKSTLLLTLMGLARMSAGSLRLDGRDIAALSTYDRVARGMTLVPERRQLFGEMIVEENLLLGAYAASGGHDVRQDLEAQYRRFPRLAERRAQRTRLMSGGEQQITAIARALMARPRLLLLDEPSLGLSPQWVQQVMDLVTALRAEGTTVLMVEQNAREALELADRGYVIETGRITRAGRSTELLADTALAEAYLGGAGGSTADGMEARLRRFRRES